MVFKICLSYQVKVASHQSCPISILNEHHTKLSVGSCLFGCVALFWVCGGNISLPRTIPLFSVLGPLRPGAFCQNKVVFERKITFQTESQSVREDRQHRSSERLFTFASLQICCTAWVDQTSHVG